jgi:type II secretion system protein G
MARPSRKRVKGFTLVELLIVIIIIAVLAAVIVPKFGNSSVRSRETALRSDLKAMRDAIDLFKADTSAYPANLTDLALSTAPATGKDSAGNNKAITAAQFKGPYIEKIKTDPVSGSNYIYSVTSPTVGKVKAPTGTATDGSDYATW